MGEVVELYPKNPGNGAREAIEEYFAEEGLGLLMPGSDLARPDHLLAALWAKGFKIVPTNDANT